MLLHVDWAATEAYIAEALSSEVEREEREADHSPPSSAEFKKRNVISPLPIRLHSAVLN
jgi:hypothetical protein